MSDQVPFGVTQVAQSVRLAGKLLYPVLAENPQSGGVGFADEFSRKGLANAHQGDFSRMTSGTEGHHGNSFADAHNVFGDGHCRDLTTGSTGEHRGMPQQQAE